MQNFFIDSKVILLEKKESVKKLLQDVIERKKWRLSEVLFFNITIAVIAAILFIPYLGTVPLFDWDEANFAESAREMIVSGDYFTVQINYQTFWEKPPLFMWLQAASMHFFGVDEFAARFPNAIAGIATLLVLFNIGYKEFDKKFGLIWVLAYAGSILPHFYFKSGIIDPVFNLFIFLGIYQFAKLTDMDRKERGRRMNKAVLGGVFIGLAVLTKGPVAFLIIWICLVVYLLVKRSIKIISFKEFFIFSAVVGVLSFGWFGVGLIKDGPYFLVEFIEYQIRLFSTEDAGHGGPFYYHFIILMIGCFPASIYVFKSFIRQYSDTPRQRNLKVWTIISLLVVLILFSIVKTKIVHYSSFCYFPITFLAAYALYKVYLHKTYFSKSFHIWFVAIGGLLSAVLIIVPLFMRHKYKMLTYFGKYIKDEMVLEAIRVPVDWTGSEISIGCFYLAAIILAMIYHYREPVMGAGILFVSTLITVQFTMYIIVPKVEEHIQGGVIEFYKSVKGQDAYVESIGFKSYADLFYSEKRPGYNPKSLDHEWLMHGDIDKPAYLVRKISRAKEMDLFPQLEKLGSKSGYVFYRREAVVSPE